MSKIIQLYNKQDAPEGAILIDQKIERNGIVDPFVRTCNVLNVNERMIYFFEVKS